MEPVKDHQGMKIIGIDNGYGNIKTANCCFPAGLTAHNTEPVFKNELLKMELYLRKKVKELERGDH